MNPHVFRTCLQVLTCHRPPEAGCSFAYAFIPFVIHNDVDKLFRWFRNISTKKCKGRKRPRLFHSPDVPAGSVDNWWGSSRCHLFLCEKRQKSAVEYWNQGPHQSLRCCKHLPTCSRNNGCFRERPYSRRFDYSMFTGCRPMDRYVLSKWSIWPVTDWV